MISKPADNYLRAAHYLLYLLSLNGRAGQVTRETNYLWVTIDVHHTWDNSSFWLCKWLHILCWSLWPIFHDLEILPCITIIVASDHGLHRRFLNHFLIGHIWSLSKMNSHKPSYTCMYTSRHGFSQFFKFSLDTHLVNYHRHLRGGTD